MEIEAAAAQAAIWDRFGLKVIPDDDLADAFARAVENIQDGETAFGAPKILAAWQDIRRERAEARTQAQPNTWHRGDEVTFAEWFAKDREWVQQNLTPDTQAMMKRLFDKRVAAANVAK